MCHTTPDKMQFTCDWFLTGGFFDEGVTIWNLKNYQPIKQLKVGKFIQEIKIENDKLITQSRNHVSIWNLNEDKEDPCFEFSTKYPECISCTLIEDDMLFMGISNNNKLLGSIHIWDFKNNQLLGNFSLNGGEIKCMQFIHGKLVVGLNKSMIILDFTKPCS